MITMFRSPSGEHSLTGGFFTEYIPDGTGERLVAAVFWRLASEDDGPRPPRGPDSDEPGRWTGSIGIGRARVQYSAERRVIRVLGRSYELPGDDETLLLLLEDQVGEDVPVVTVVTVASMPAPVAVGTRPRGGPTNKEDHAKAYAEYKRAQTMVWNKAVHAHPDVIRFFARG